MNSLEQGRQSNQRQSSQTYAERYAEGKALREKCPRASHHKWKAPAGRPNAVDLVLEAEAGRRRQFLPLRHSRMARSPFAFFRGAALTMASDLTSTLSTGVRVQCCGDAHLCNFGGFATPERRVIFSINDLDETLPAFWEWDLKRMAASFVIACRENRVSDASARDVATACVRSYRVSMAEFSRMSELEVWYYTLSGEDLVRSIGDDTTRRRAIRRLQKEESNSAAEDLALKLLEYRDGVPVIRERSPAIFHVKGHPPRTIPQVLVEAFNAYRETLPDSVRALLGRYELQDAAMRVVGVGSVGRSSWVLLLMAGRGDPLFLQLKEAGPSVLEAYAGASVYHNHGQRVVNGYRLMQPFSDVFLGWSNRASGRYYYVRHLRDAKISLRVETFGRSDFEVYANWCGRALANSHARSGNPAMLAGYMGKSGVLDASIADFAIAYADQNERDYAAFTRAIRSGKVTVAPGEPR